MFMAFAAESERIKARIREALDDSGLSMRAASIKAGLGETAIRDLMRNDTQSPTTRTLRKLAPVLGKSFEWLSGGDLASVTENEEMNRLLTEVLGGDKRAALLEYARFLAKNEGCGDDQTSTKKKAG